MLNRDELILEINKIIEGLDRVSTIPKELSFEDKTILALSRTETCRVLRELLELAEAKRSEELPKKHELIP